MDRTAGEEHAINFGRKDACLYSAEVPPSVPSDYEIGIAFHSRPIPYQPKVPWPPLNGPTIFLVIQPP
jgi:hypothetical protein